MWIVFGTADKTTRVPGGAKVDRRCEQCGETTTFYEKEVLKTFRLYFIDIFDFQRQRVMACGGCGACYATDELGPPKSPGWADAPRRFDDLRAEVGRAAHRAGGAFGRAAGVVEAKVSALLADGRAPSPDPVEIDRREPPDDEVDETERRFRELERQDRARIKG